LLRQQRAIAHDQPPARSRWAGLETSWSSMRAQTRSIDHRWTLFQRKTDRNLEDSDTSGRWRPIRCRGSWR
jgi:hypothetical protein